MDVTFLQNNLDVLLTNMEVQAFCKDTISICNRIGKEIIMNPNAYTMNSFDEVWKVYKQKFSTLSSSTLRGRYAALKIVFHFANFKEFPIHQLSQRQLTLEIHSKGRLDLLPLQHDFDKLICALKAEGYKVGKKSRIRTTIGRIIILARTIEWNSFQDIRDWYSIQEISKSHRTHIIETVDKIEGFMVSGKIPVHPSIQHKLNEVIPSIGALDLTFLQEHLPELLSYMEDMGYGRDYREKVSNIANRIIILSRSILWNSYNDIWFWYQSNTHGKKYLHEIRSILGLLSDFQIEGRMPNNRETQNVLCPRDNNYNHLLPQYRNLVDYVNGKERQRGLKESSVLRTKQGASSFLRYIQERGIDSLDTLTEEIVLDFFFFDGEEKHGYATLVNLRRFITKCCDICDTCKAILTYLPVLRNARKTIQYLTVDEIISFKSAIFDSSNSLSFKDRAIGGFLIYTAMRCSDIASLTIDAFDLKTNTFFFIQEKTSNPVTLTFNNNLGNLVYDYCVNQRENTGNNSLFLMDSPPYHSLGTGGIDWAASKIMAAAGIRQGEGDRKGTHIFRHRGATTMAQSNVPAPVISTIMGHESPKSLGTYLSADFKHLKICALGLEQYPLSEEVFLSV